MPYPSPALISDIRAASRDLVREFGFMSRTLAGTDLPPSAVHAVIEIGAAGRLTAKDLSEKLLLEKSTVSRLVGSLIDHGLVSAARSDTDGRQKHLRLTGAGEATLAGVTRFAEGQVVGAIGPLADASRSAILTGLRTYSAALKAGRTAGGALPARTAPVVEEGYAPGLVGRVTEMQIACYADLLGFGAPFESRVAGEMAEFVTRLESPDNAIWRAETDGRIVGSISIDGEDLGDRCGHLRWFIVEAGLRGAGLGDRLIRAAVAFCDERGFRETHLWTVKGLDAARTLYERHGFSLAEEYRGDQWGAEALEQEFVRPLPR